MKHDPITIFHSGEWSALYIDGKLAYVGDTYLVWEHLESHFGWDVRDSDAYFKPDLPQRRENVYQTLEELRAGAIEQKRRENERRLDELEAEKEELEYEIERLRELTS